MFGNVMRTYQGIDKMGKYRWSEIVGVCLASIRLQIPLEDIPSPSSFLRQFSRKLRQIEGKEGRRKRMLENMKNDIGKLAGTPHPSPFVWMRIAIQGVEVLEALDSHPHLFTDPALLQPKNPMWIDHPHPTQLRSKIWKTFSFRLRPERGQRNYQNQLFILERFYRFYR